MPLIAVLVLGAAAGAGALLRPEQAAAPPGPPPVQEPAVILQPVVEDGSTRVQFTPDVAAHPAAGDLRELLQTHFDAINARDYDRWSTTVAPDLADARPEPEWVRGYRSTENSDIVAHRLESTPEGDLVVLLSFTSRQDPADAPPDKPSDCLLWRLSYSVEVGDDGEFVFARASDPTASQNAYCVPPG